MRRWMIGMLTAGLSVSAPWAATTSGAAIAGAATLDEVPLEALRRAAVPLSSVAYGTGDEDLEAFGRAVGHARVVGLGEATHGTREFNRMRHRLIEYLVRRKGFRVLALEDNLGYALTADRFVTRGEGTARDVLNAGFGIWNTQEMLDLVRWVRTRNADLAPDDQVRIAGFDMQLLEVPAARISNWLATQGPRGAELAEAGLEPLKRLPYRTTPSERQAACRSALEAIGGLIEASRAVIVGAHGRRYYDHLRHDARVLEQYEKVESSQPLMTGDQAMAENVRWLAEVAYPGQKIILWAHNGHIASNLGQHATMGGYLRQAYGRDYHALGFSFGGGEVRARSREAGKPFRHFQLPAPREHTLDAALARVGLPLFYLDLHRSDPTLGAWLSRSHARVNIGHSYEPGGFYLMGGVPNQIFDSLIFVRETHGASGLID